MQMIEDLFDQLNKQSDPPCVKFDCSHRDRCASDELACTAFAHYYQTGKVVHPFWDFPQHGSSLQKPIWRTDALPSARIWALIESDDWGNPSQEARVLQRQADAAVDRAIDERTERKGPDHWMHVGLKRAKIALERFRDGR
jgi:hypothetical protein